MGQEKSKPTVNKEKLEKSIAKKNKNKSKIVRK